MSDDASSKELASLLRITWIVCTFVIVFMLASIAVFSANADRTAQAQEASTREIVDTPISTDDVDMNNVITPQSGDTDINTLAISAQDAIDALPDATAADFAIATNNVDSLIAQLQNVSAAMGELNAAAGYDKAAELDTARFDALTAAVEVYQRDTGGEDSRLQPQAGVPTYFTIASVQAAGITDATFATAVYDSIVSNWDNYDTLQKDKNGHTKKNQTGNYTYLPQSPTAIDTILNDGTTSDAQKVEAIIENYCGDIMVTGTSCKSMVGIDKLLWASTVTFMDTAIIDLTPFASHTGTIGVPDRFGVLDLDQSESAINVYRWPKNLANTCKLHTHTISLMAFNYWDLAYHYTTTSNHVVITANPLLMSSGSDGILNTSDGSVGAYYDYTPAGEQEWWGMNSWDATTDDISLPPIEKEGEFYSYSLCVLNAAMEEGGYTLNYFAGENCIEPQAFSPGYTYLIPVSYYAYLTQDDTRVVVGGFEFKKVSSEDGSKPIAGATYRIYADAACTKPVYAAENSTASAGHALLVTDATREDYGNLATAGTLLECTTDSEGGFTVDQLPAGTYYVKESKAPAGYHLNPNTTAVAVDVGDSGLTFTEALTGGEDAKYVYNTATTTSTGFDYGQQTVTFDAPEDGSMILTTTAAQTVNESTSTLRFIQNAGSEITTLIGQVESGNYTTVNESASYTTAASTANENASSEWKGKSLTDAKKAINDQINNEELTGDIAVTSHAIYQSNASITVMETPAEDTPLPVNLTLAAQKIFTNGTLSGTSGDLGYFTFTMTPDTENDVASDPITNLIPTGQTALTLHNDDNGVISIGDFSYSKAGTYTYVLEETQRISPEIDYDTTTSHTLTVTVTEVPTLGGFQAAVTLDGTVVSGSPFTGAGTNTVNEGTGEVTPAPEPVSAGVFTNSLKSSAVVMPLAGSNQFLILLLAGFTFLVGSLVLWFHVKFAKNTSQRSDALRQHDDIAALEDNPSSAKTKVRIVGVLLALLLIMTALFAFIPAAAQANETPQSGTGTLIIDSSQGAQHTYSAYRLISGYVEGDTISYVAIDRDVPNAMWDILGVPTDQRSATAICDWFAAQVNADTDGAFPPKVAEALVDSGGMSATATFATGQPVTLSDGYYLITAEDTEPLLLLVGGGETLTVYEKSFTPTVDKKISRLEPDTTDFGSIVDAGIGQTLEYHLDGTLPSNYGLFTTYYYRFNDTFDTGIDIDAGSVKVQVVASDGTVKSDITSGAQIILDDTTLTVTFDDLKQSYPVRTEGDFIRVDYTAALNTSATVGGVTVNKNDVSLTYTSTPSSGGTGETPHVQVYTPTWMLKVVKLDSNSRAVLPGARFTVQNSSSAYVNSDGTTSPTMTAASTYISDASGQIYVTCLGPDTYTITETEAPDGYMTVSPFEVTISSKVSLTSATMTVTVDNAGSAIELASVDDSTGAVNLNVLDTPAAAKSTFGNKVTNMLAKTGDASHLFLILALLAAGVIAIYIGRKHDGHRKEDSG